MHAIHVIAGLRPEDGGPSYTVPRLCRSLATAGAKIDLLTVATAATDTNSGGHYCEHRFPWDFARVPGLRQLRASSGLAQTLRRQAPLADVIHNHGLWLMPNVYTGREAARSRRPLVFAPRGMLSAVALSFSKLKKRGFWHLMQRQAAFETACFHATSHQEYEEIRAFGLRKPVAIIPNGIDVDSTRAPRRGSRGPRTVLSLGRIHPKKNLDMLLRAWARVEAENPEWRLRIVGPAENGHDAELRALASRLGLCRAAIEGPVYGAQKDTEYRSADIFMLPTRNENFGMTVAEALAAGVPVIATRGAPWKGLVDEGCGWWIEIGEDSLAAALRESLSIPPDQLSRMGERGRKWMLRDFSWDRVAADMLDLYRWLKGSAPMPTFVHTN